MTTRLVEEKQFDELLHWFAKELELKSFAELGHRPEVTRTRVAACFADIRGFTNLVEKAQYKGRRTATLEGQITSRCVLSTLARLNKKKWRV